MAEEEKGQKRKIGSARITWLQLLVATLGVLALMLGFFLQDEFAKQKAIDGDYCLKHEDERIQEYNLLKKQVFKLKAQHINDSVEIANNKQFKVESNASKQGH